jgi:hypothetical protein
MVWRRWYSPQQSRVAQHHDQRIALAPGQPELRKVHLPLTARRRLEPYHGLGFRLRPDLTDIILHLGVATAVTGRLDLVEQAYGRQICELA